MPQSVCLFTSMNRKKLTITQKFSRNLTGFFIFFFALGSCKQEPVDLRIKTLSFEEAQSQAATIEAMVKPELHEDFQLSIWAVDSLVADPISMRIDADGRLFYSRTNRRKISEFDIRSHQDWEIQSIKMQSAADRKHFIHEELSPENTGKNEWLPDINGDGSHDWRDLTVEKENVYRLEDTDGSGLADLSQLVVEDFHEEITDVAGAVLYHEGELFVGVAPDLWKLTDTNGDGLMDTKVSLMHGFGVHIGFGGHNISGLTIGPEGKIYWGIGDIGFSGTDATGKKWHFPNEGVVVRCNTDGSDFEVFAHGVRNTHEFVFDEFANLISVDNDGDHRGERERIVYLVDGSDTGWRINWQFGKYRDPDNNNYKVWMDENMHTPSSPDKAAYFIPTIANYVNGPTGMVYNPGTALGPEWQNTFFVAEFAGNPARSGIHGFKLKQNGAGFELEKTEQLMGGILATGMDFGPDGALYFSDWIDGWVNKGYGRIWKMDLARGAFTAERENTAELMREDFNEMKTFGLGELLGHPDQRIRRKAQFALAKKGDDGFEIFKEQLQQTKNRMARIHAIWGISQLARNDAQVGKELIPYLKDGDEEIKAQAAKWIGNICLAGAGSDLVALLEDSNSRVRFFAAEALGRIAYTDAVGPLVKMLEENNNSDVYLRHAGSLALARIGNAAPIIALENHASKAVRTAAVLALRRMGNAGVLQFLNDSDEYIVAEAARAINDDFSIPEALPALAEILSTTKFISEPLIRRAINANVRVGTEKSMNNLISYLNNPQATKAMKIEALEALGSWAKPSVLDRVDGRYRGEIERDPNPLRLASKDVIMELLASPDEEIRIAAVKSIAKIDISDASDRLFVMLAKDLSPQVREASLVSITTMKEVPVDKAIELALSDVVLLVRVAGLGLIDQLEVAEELKANLLEDVIVKQTVEEKQAALLSLGKINKEHAKPVFENILSLFEAEKLAPEIELELIEALENINEPSLTARYNEIRGNRNGEDLLASYSGSMYGGDPGEGRKIFFQHPTGQCIKCHSYDDLGGNAGPRLNGIGSHLSRKELLEALIDPSKRLAPGFGIVILDLKDDQKLAGVLAAENNDSITVKMGNKPDTVILKEHIVLRDDAPSSMPDMKQYLDRREIRDLISYLASLK